jgi:Holliday junction resolvase RusA-like endonuclease
MPNEIEIELPWPPSANIYWRSWRGRGVVSAEARAYKAHIKKLSLTWPKVFFEKEETSFLIRAFPPDRRKRDLSNTIKIIEDSLEGILYTNDFQTAEIHILRSDVYTGKIVLRLKERIREKSMFIADQLRQYVIIPALSSIALDGDSAETLLMATCAQESKGGTYLHQLGNGPALGIYQMEPATYQNVISYIQPKQTLRQNILSSCNFDVFPPPIQELITNLKYATIIARVHYSQFEEALPTANDMEGMWNYYKKYWNTSAGSATQNEFYANWKAFLG